MKRTSKELKRIARDILNDRYRVPMAGFSAPKRSRRSSTIGSRKNAPRSMRVVVKVKGPTESMPRD